MEIENFPNYLIYPDGRVYSKKNDKFLKHILGGSGYRQVSFRKHGKIKTFTIHRLIAMHYIPNDENKREVDHMNRDKSDNRVENLRWATRSENQQNKGKNKLNKSGHRYICYHNKGYWRFQKRINKKLYTRDFKSKIDCICYKFIILLKIKSSLKIIN